MKTCIKCRVCKPLIDFRTRLKKEKIVQVNVCRECQNARERELSLDEGRKEKKRKRQRKAYQNNLEFFRAKRKRLRVNETEETKQSRKAKLKDYYLQNAEYLKQYRRDYVRDNRDVVLAKQRAFNQAKRDEKRDFLATQKTEPCLDCGLKFPSCCMDFDHLPGQTKVATVSKMVANPKYSIEDMTLEIQKCELVCANCHRIRTWVVRGRISEPKLGLLCVASTG